MPSYDFRGLSPFEFECLTRDLLQLELKVHLESFSRGRDGGIDLRCAKSLPYAWIVQCKHYVETGWLGLRSNLRKEAAKVNRLKPSRYIVATSVSLTPGNKQEILSLFAPYLTTPADIFGQDDLNNLLGKHGSVEKNHFKLWLSSTGVLQKILHAHVYANTDNHIFGIEKKVKLYVVNPSYDRAADLLQKHRFCLIAGMPGIGKSMLAEMLMVRHIDRGFIPVVVSADVSEANLVFDVSEKQIFYYDDFLGQTGRADKLGKNEDARLLAFIRRVVNSPNKRLILTTREHILAQAKLRYERLSEEGVSVGTCMVSLQDYAELVRAKIFYNHIYFSDLAFDTRIAVLKGRAYVRVIKHPNYSPRLIEKIIDFAQVRALNGQNFVAFMLETLDRPGQLWRHAFDNQLSEYERSVLLSLASLPADVEFGDLERATGELCRLRMGSVPTPSEFRRSLKVMENTFITMETSDASVFVKYHNPSIRDFIHSVLEEHPGELALLLRSALFFDQCIRLWAHRKEVPGIGQGLAEYLELVVDALKRTIASESIEFVRVPSSAGVFHARIGRSAEQRYADVLDIVMELKESSLNPWLSERLEALTKSWTAGNGDKVAAARLVKHGALPPAAVSAAKEFLLSDTDDRSDIDALSLLVGSEFLDSKEMLRARELFVAVADEATRYALEDCDDPEEVRSTRDWIVATAHDFGADYYADDEEFDARIGSLEDERPEDDYDPDVRGSAPAGERSDEREIDSMFESLTVDEPEEVTDSNDEPQR